MASLIFHRACIILRALNSQMKDTLKCLSTENADEMNYIASYSAVDSVELRETYSFVSQSSNKSEISNRCEYFRIVHSRATERHFQTQSSTETVA
jgi:hypothetical protein